MNTSTSYWLKKGIHNGMPIALGYLAVSFTLGIAAKNAGLTALQAALASITCHASAGEFAGFTLIAALATYTEIAVMELIINARYFLMSCALSQKIYTLSLHDALPISVSKYLDYVYLFLKSLIQPICMVWCLLHHLPGF